MNSKIHRNGSRLLLRRRETLFHGLEPLVHLLKQVLEFFEPWFGGELFIAGLGGFFAGIAGTGMSTWLSTSGILQARDLRFDHRRHFDAEVVALQQSFERGNGSAIATRTECMNGSHANRKVRFGEISRNPFRDVLVVLLQTREAVDRGGARIDGLAGG